MDAVIHRAQVTRTNSQGVFVIISELGRANEFGPIPVTGTFSAGDQVIVGQVGDVEEDLVLLGGSGGGSAPAVDTTPVGTIFSSAAFAIPAGYLWCDGSEVARSTYPALFAALVFTITGSTTAGSNVITGVSTTVGVNAGKAIGGSGIPVGATVLSVNAGASTITISANATATAAGVSIDIGAFGVGDGSTTFNLPDTKHRALRGVGAGKALGANDGLAEASRDAAWSHSHAHTATVTTTATASSVSAGTPTGSLSSVSAGTPSGSLSSDSAGTPAGSLNSVSAGTPAGSIGDHPSHTHSDTFAVASGGAFTTAIGVSVGSHADHTHQIAMAGALNTTASGSSTRVTTVGGGSVAAGAATTYGTSEPGGAATHSVTVTQQNVAAHSHSLTGAVGAPSATLSHVFTGSALAGHSHTFTGSAMTAHSHTFTGSALATHTHTFTGAALTAHTHTVTATSTATVDSATPPDHPNLYVRYIIKT